MNIRDRRAIKNTAADALRNASGRPGRLVLLYAGVACLLSLLVTLAIRFLGQQMEGAGGLQHIRLRSTLSTIVYLLPLIQSLLLRVWDLGYQSVALSLSRKEPVTPRTLLSGFPRFGALLSSLLLQAVIYMALALFSLSLSSNIFMMTPFSKDFYEILTPLLADTSVLSGSLSLDATTIAELSGAMTPMLIIFGIVYLAVFLPIYFNYRMVPYCILDQPGQGGFAALRSSRIRMRRNRLALFQLDLSFWWYYGLQALVMVLAYADTLLPLFGIPLPFSETTGFYLFYVLSLMLQLAVFYFALNRVSVSYATAYEALKPPTLGNRQV